MKNNPQKFTKIVATIGPVTETEAKLKAIFEAGVDVARFNTKHGTPEWHHERILRVRKVAKEMNKPVAVLMDLQGPEIRINLPDEDEFSMKKGDAANFLADGSTSNLPNAITIPEIAIEMIETGQLILIDDGFCQFEVITKKSGHFEAVALDDFVVKHRKSMSLPGLVTDMPVLVENDYTQLDGIQDNEVDYIALSFVRDKEDVLTLRKELEKRDLTAGVIAKVENQAALDNLSEITEVSDGIMIARGDLGVEVSYEELVYWQRKIITVCRERGKPVITATHMLETMIENPLPTRAEISDVAHAIYDRTDAVMLSGETTIGKFPVKAVTVQAKIAKFNEKHVEPKIQQCGYSTGEYNISHAAANLVINQPAKIDSVICLTEKGRTAALISRQRPNLPVHVITSSEQVYHKLALYYGLIPHIVDWPTETKLGNAKKLVEMIGDVEWLESGQKVLVLHGPVWGQPGKTNTMSIETIE
ncbi:MAG: pyruvate kinase [Patescibacteria group bacterium]|nr:pyruvate kinase [Patescibacteria group bacterium]